MSRRFGSWFIPRERDKIMTVECTMPIHRHEAPMRNRSRVVAPFILVCVLSLLGPSRAHAQTSPDDIRAQMDAIYARVQTLRLSYDKKDQLKADNMMRDYDRLKNRLELEIRTQQLETRSQRTTKVTSQQRIEPTAQAGARPNPTPTTLSTADAERRDKTKAAIQKCMDSIRLPENCATFVTTECINAKVREKRRCEAIGLAPANAP